MSRYARHAMVVLSLVVVAACASSVDAALSPRATYTALLTSPFKAPSGFSNPRITSGKLDATDRKRGGVGQVQIELDGPNGTDVAIFYSVYENRARALYALKHPRLANYQAVGPVRGCTPSATYTASITGKNVLGKKVTNGVTLMGCVIGNVIVSSATLSIENENSGDFIAARKLLTAGIKHLRAVTS